MRENPQGGYWPIDTVQQILPSRYYPVDTTRLILPRCPQTIKWTVPFCQFSTSFAPGSLAGTAYHWSLVIAQTTWALLMFKLCLNYQNWPAQLSHFFLSHLTLITFVHLFSQIYLQREIQSYRTSLSWVLLTGAVIVQHLVKASYTETVSISSREWLKLFRLLVEARSVFSEDSSVTGKPFNQPKINKA